MDYFNSLIYVVIFIKVIFIILSIVHLELEYKGKTNSKMYKTIEYWRERMEFIFVFLMSLIIIYVFYPYSDRSNKLTKETKILLYLFGFILIITADWNNFIHQARWFTYLQRILK